MVRGGVGPYVGPTPHGLQTHLRWTGWMSLRWALRFIVDNGWPLDLNGSVTFINAEGDSLLAGPDYRYQAHPTLQR